MAIDPHLSSTFVARASRRRVRIPSSPWENQRDGFFDFESTSGTLREVPRSFHTPPAQPTKRQPMDANAGRAT